MIGKNSLVARIYRKKDIDKIKAKLDLFGVKKKLTVESFMNLRLYSTVLLFFIIFLVVDGGVVLAPIIAAVYYYILYYLMIEIPLKKRERRLDREAYYYFEVLTLALESGRNLETAISMACKYIDSEVSDEFKETLKHVNFGKSLPEALSQMNLRIPSTAINNIILNIEQSNVFGNSIIDTMYNQLDFLKEKQIMDVKAAINKLPNKISIFSVLFFVPLLLLLILGPVILQFINI
ncbi:MAG TPA: type II secretion system F family protein [Bacilli bacterium]|nr:type II secretion system F family protein [Bacilli bacterium]